MSTASKSMLFRSGSALIILLAACLGFWQNCFNITDRLGLNGPVVYTDPAAAETVFFTLWLTAFGYTCLAHQWWKASRGKLRAALSRKELGSIALMIEPWLYYTRWFAAWFVIVIAGNIGAAVLTGGIGRLLLLVFLICPIDWLIKTTYGTSSSETISALPH